LEPAAHSTGLVGRRLMMHPFGPVVGLFDEDLQSMRGVWGQHLHSLEFYETDTARGFARFGCATGSQKRRFENIPWAVPLC
jgi:hypothetical protein